MNDARKISLFILNEFVLIENEIKTIINELLVKYRIDDLDKRLTNEICKGTVRNLYLLDFIISNFSKINIDNIEIPVLNILRTGTYQIFFLNRIPDYSIINEGVELAKKYSGISSSKFVNAILRKISQITDINSFIDGKMIESGMNELEKLGIKQSFPLWLIKYWSEFYGFSDTEKICMSLNSAPITYLRINRLKNTKEQIISRVKKENKISEENILYLNTDENEKKIFEDSIALKRSQNIANSGYYKEGCFSFQDFSSQIAVKYFLNPKQNEKILDLCSAPGGKTSYIAELMNNSGEIIHYSLNNRRMQMLADNLKRLNINNVKTLITDITKKNFLENAGLINYLNYFDKIFIDAPCSALGTISKNPDVKYNKNTEDLKRLSEVTFKMFINSYKYLKNNGRIVFYTCTLSRIENQELLKRIIEDPVISFEYEKTPLSDKITEYLNNKKIFIGNIQKKYFEIIPYYFNSEGGFVSSLIKKST
ncbi:MAG: 16S rRNA (cytosine(967)-C(5))-methyltransferase RsmB [Cyanobacteria bacterium]|nr:16S rRNA (cytosine(967)-C(5))-methyltransferase RsmB [Cyanobacteriota bacterium]